MRSESSQNWKQNVIGKRRCNALIKDAEADFAFAEGITLGRVKLGDVNKTVGIILPVFKQLMGGLWVGGITYLTKDAVSFRPNFANRLVHKQDCSVEVPLGEITDVQERFGFFTKIIDIKTSKATLSIRCFSTASFIDMINNARRN